MMRINRGFRWCLVMAGALAAGCSDTPDETNVESLPVDTVQQVSQDKVFYQVPGPNEMFAFIKESSNSGTRVTSLLNNPDNYNRYNDLHSKSVNFGIFSTDLLYCSTFDLGPEVMKYFAVVKKMSDDLGISSAIRDSDMKRIENSIGNNDSLTSVANDIYYNTYQTLEENDQGKVLAQMVAGGWIESLYLVTKMNPDYDEGSPVFQRVADQKLILENLIKYMAKYKGDAGVDATLKKLDELTVLFAELGNESQGATTIDRRDGKMVLSGGSAITMNAEQYAALAAKVEEIRNEMTGSNI